MAWTAGGAFYNGRWAPRDTAFLELMPLDESGTRSCTGALFWEMASLMEQVRQAGRQLLDAGTCGRSPPVALPPVPEPMIVHELKDGCAYSVLCSPCSQPYWSFPVKRADAMWNVQVPIKEYTEVGGRSGGHRTGGRGDCLEQSTTLAGILSQSWVCCWTSLPPPAAGAHVSPGAPVPS
jgi:hypothetical protein